MLFATPGFTRSFGLCHVNKTQLLPRVVENDLKGDRTMKKIGLDESAMLFKVGISDLI